VVSAVARYSIGSGMYFRPAAIVSRIPHAVAAGRALSLSMNFFEMVYSFLTINRSHRGIQIAVRQADVKRITNVVWETLEFSFDLDAKCFCQL
jgi:hypothetical protein